MGKRRLEADLAAPPLEQRPSVMRPALRCKSAWTPAQVDVYSPIAQRTAASAGIKACANGVADLSQSTDRVHVCVQGGLPTCCTRSTLYHFGQQRFLTRREQPAAHGLFVLGQGAPANEIPQTRFRFGAVVPDLSHGLIAQKLEVYTRCHTGVFCFWGFPCWTM